MTKTQNIFTNDKEWSGYTVKESEKGWITEGWSRNQGSLTDYKFLTPFENCDYQAGTNLEDDHNEYMSIGDYIARGTREGRMVLRKGHRVE